MTGGTRRLQVEPDVVLPSQMHARAAATAESRLLLAVLAEAVATFQRYALEGDRHGRALFGEARAWFASDDATDLCCFVCICDALAIDASYVRAGLDQWRRAHRPRSLDVVQPVFRFPFRRVNGSRHRTSGRPLGAKAAT